MYIEQIENDQSVLSSETATLTMASGEFKQDNCTLPFIQAANGTPLCKDLTTGDSYPKIVDVNSTHFESGPGDDLAEFIYEIIKLQADVGAALLTGRLKKTLMDESRAGHVEPADTWVLILDVDADLPYESRDEFMEDIGIDSSYVFQHSSSSKSDDSLRGHYLVPLSEQTGQRKLKTYLKGLNFKHFKSLLTLSNNQQTLKWPLDTVVNDAARIVYIAPPVMEGKDHITERILLRKGSSKTFSLPAPFPSEVTGMINSLRKQQQLAVIPNAGTKKIITVDPKEVKITGHKQNGEFGYLNLNGGDSWGYHYPLDNPEIIRNFKGEPNMRMKDLDKVLYEQLRAELPGSLDGRARDAQMLELKKKVIRDLIAKGALI